MFYVINSLFSKVYYWYNKCCIKYKRFLVSENLWELLRLLIPKDDIECCNVLAVLIFSTVKRSANKTLFHDFSPINMHGKCGFGLLNHIAGRVKIVLGKKKADKHIVWASRETTEHRLANPEACARYMCTGTWNTCTGQRNISRRIFSERRWFSCTRMRNVTPSRLFRKNIRSSTLFPPKQED